MCVLCLYSMCIVCDLLGDVVALPHGLQLAALHRALHHHRLGLVTARQLALHTHNIILLLMCAPLTLVTPQPTGAQSSLGSAWQLVSGVYLVTLTLSRLHLWTGHSSHSALVW